MTKPSDVLEVKDLVVHFPGRHGEVVKAVDGVSFNIARGEILALVGESGCGKTTIAMAVMRLVVPTSGTIITGGEDLTNLHGRDLRQARRHIQMIFQDPFGSLDARQTVYESVVEPLIIPEWVTRRRSGARKCSKPWTSRTSDRLSDSLRSIPISFLEASDSVSPLLPRSCWDLS